jgi:DNA-binding NtrC family response regulator
MRQKELIVREKVTIRPSLNMIMPNISTGLDSSDVIMVVDDDRDVLTVTTMMLERNGHKVHAFSDPFLALKHLTDGCTECGLVISDIIMSGMTGIELAISAKKSRPLLRFVVMSSLPVRKKEWRSIIPASGVIDDFLPKPFSMEELAGVVARYGKEQLKPNDS